MCLQISVLPGLVLTLKKRSLNASMDVRSFVAFS